MPGEVLLVHTSGVSWPLGGEGGTVRASISATSPGINYLSVKSSRRATELLNSIQSGLTLPVPARRLPAEANNIGRGKWLGKARPSIRTKAYAVMALPEHGVGRCSLKMARAKRNNVKYFGIKPKIVHL